MDVWSGSLLLIQVGAVVGSEEDTVELETILTILESQLQALDEVASRRGSNVKPISLAAANLSHVISQVRAVCLAAEIEVFDASEGDSDKREG